MHLKAMIFSIVLVGSAAGAHHSALADGDDHGGLSFSFGLLPPPVYYQSSPPPVYYRPAPPPAYYRPPPPVYYTPPPPVYYQPAPAYWGHHDDDDEGDDD